MRFGLTKQEPTRETKEYEKNEYITTKMPIKVPQLCTKKEGKCFSAAQISPPK